MDYKALMISGAKELGIELGEKQGDMFLTYMAQLIEWSKKINLTAIAEPQEIIEKHFLDSLSALAALGTTAGSLNIIDIGTGAGFPGLPIKIALPACKITLMDSVNKKLEFIRSLAGVLNMTDIEVVHARAEDAGHDNKYRERYDLCVSRAVAPFDVLCELCLPFVQKGGKLIAYKGPGYGKELQEGENALKILGGAVDKVVHVKVPGTDLSHNIIIVSKIKHTPAKYPRKPAVVRVNPIR